MIEGTIAATNLAIRIYKLTVQVSQHTDRGCLPVIIRGYNPRTEVQAFTSFAAEEWTEDMAKKKGGMKPDPYQSSTWEYWLSPAFWLFTAIKCNGDQAGLPLPPKLLAVRETAQNDPKFAGLLQYFNGEIEHFGQVRGPGGRRGEGLVGELLSLIVDAADALVTTPHMYGEPLYIGFRDNIARGIALNEAGAMKQQDVILAMDRGLRPCLLGGDEKQLTPTVMTHAKRDTITEKPLNMFASFAKISVLEHLKRTSYPFIMLSTQYRIVNGGFDVALDVCYPEFKANFKYGPTTSLKNHPKATKVEAWASTALGATRSPRGKVLPLFLNCPGICYQSESWSRFNYDQCDRAGLLVDNLLGSGLGITAGDIGIITPYRANMEVMEGVLARGDPADHPSRRNVQVDTADSFQGCERSIVIFVLTVNSVKGPQFVADPHRICLDLSRHRDFLFVIGDLDTC
ncbi:hypothetical protein OQA88_700 [Cercophora sp. LCS_1]